MISFGCRTHGELNWLMPYVAVAQKNPFVELPDIAPAEWKHGMYTTFGSAGSTGFSSKTSICGGCNSFVVAASRSLTSSVALCTASFWSSTVSAGSASTTKQTLMSLLTGNASAQGPDMSQKIVLKSPPPS